MATEDLSGSRIGSESLTRPVVDRPVVDRKFLGIGSLLLGLGILYFVGFTPAMAVHNAAHDTRHTAAFPCH
jgi:cobalt transporter subunit CbtB